MHRKVKKQILEIMESIEEALQYMKRAQEADCRAMAEDCRMCTKTIADALDAEKQVEQDALAALTRFDQTLDASLAFLTKRERWLFKLSALQKQLTDVKRRIQEIKPRLEVVFLPYKASMWDSLESIWRAADADPDCDAYVVPIPYYDLNPDHTPAKFHYEGDLYPEDVPITDYRKYDLVARRPDVIYIHNPYDGCNCVTSVDPAYYSDRLKQYTDMLVYVPYDVAMDGINEHMCEMPGVQNADRVIVQSEKIKQIYAKYMPEEKVLALGSPKIDKVLWTQEHPPAMPEEWAKIARGRKLILYNTHLSPLIIDDGSVCRKLQYVFSVYKKRDDVCLLWRPHPLSEATMKAMNPKPLREYLLLVEAYKHEKWGIYDDSSNVHRAIALSSAYYGDASSLVAMYGITGKPIMIQHMEIYGGDYTEERQHLSFTDAFIDKNTMWFSACNYNGLFKYDLLKRKLFYVMEFPQESSANCLYAKIIHIKHKLYFIPYEANEIAEFNLQNSELKKYSIEISKYICKECIHTHFYKFQWAFLVGEIIWMIPRMGHVIVKFDTKTGKIEYYNEWRKLLKEHMKLDCIYDFSDAVCVLNEIWAIVFESDIILRFDLETNKSAIFRIDMKNKIYINMTFDGSNVWVLSKNNEEIVSICLTDKSKKSYQLLRKERNRKVLYRLCVYNNGVIWIFPEEGENIIIFDIEKKNLKKEIQYPKNYFFFSDRNGYRDKFFGVIVNEGDIIALPYRGNKMLEIKGNTKKLFTYSISINCSENCTKLEQYQEMYDCEYVSLIYYENTIYSTIYTYIDFVSQREKLCTKKRSSLFEDFFVPFTRKSGEKSHKEIVENIKIKRM